MKTLISCLIAFALIATVLPEETAARGPGAGPRGGAAGRAAAGPRPGPAAGTHRPAAPGGVLPAGPANGAQGAFRDHATGNAQNLSQHLGITPGDARTAVSQAAAQWGSGLQPFSPAWYAQHPQAWHYTHPYAGAAVAVSAVAVANWLAVPVAGYGGSTSMAVVDQSAEGSGYDEAQPAKPAEPVGVEEEPIDAPVDPNTGDSGQWMSLGAFALSPPGQTQATRMVHLAVAHDGTIRGSYYDLISDDARSIQGSVNKASLRAFWSVGAKSGITFEATLQELTRPAGTVKVHFPDGNTAAWKINQVPPSP